MKISEVIILLYDILEKNGDVEFGAVDHEYGCCHVADIALEKSNRDTQEYENFKDDKELGEYFVRSI